MMRFFAVASIPVLLLTSAAAGEPGHHHHKHHDQRKHGHAHHGGDGQRGLSHRFRDAKRWAKRFDSPERDRWQKPDAVIAALGLKPSMKIADIGAATGYFSVRFARQVPSGKVFGIDIESDMVRYLKRRAQREKLGNLSSVRGAPSDPRIPEPVDVIFVCNTYHHISARTRYFQRLRAKIRPSGRLVIVDFRMGKIPVGPPERHRIKPERLDRELRAAGYRRVSLDTRTLPYQYIATYVAK